MAGPTHAAGLHESLGRQDAERCGYLHRSQSGIAYQLVHPDLTMIWECVQHAHFSQGEIIGRFMGRHPELLINTATWNGD